MSEAPRSRAKLFPLPLASVAAPRLPKKAAVPSAKPPSGLGLDSSEVRGRMATRLREQGICHEAVIAVMARVPRHLFVDSALANQAYEDTSLPIGFGQTISKPTVVARMIELLMAGANARAKGSLGQTLEIGTGCGYQAAVLSHLAKQVMTIERIKPLHDKAREQLRSLRLPHIRLVYGDGMLGHAPNAPYDSIIAAAGGEDLPPAWLSQLAVGGRLIAPVHEAAGSHQVLMVVDKTEEGLTRTRCESVHFVPLKAGLER